MGFQEQPDYADPIGIDGDDIWGGEAVRTSRSPFTFNPDDQTWRQLVQARNQLFLPNDEGKLGTTEDIPIYKYVIKCGCGLYDANSLEDYDSHLAELVADNDGNIMKHTPAVVMVRIEE